jgi:hypothetical protein
MIWNHLKEKNVPRRIFIRDIIVKDTKNLTQTLENISTHQNHDTYKIIVADISNKLNIPVVSETTVLNCTDLVIDIDVINWKVGASNDLSVGFMDIPLYWRPKIHITFNIYESTSNHLKRTIETNIAMPLREYILRVVNWRVVIGLEPPARKADMQNLLTQAGKKLASTLSKI